MTAMPIVAPPTTAPATPPKPQFTSWGAKVLHMLSAGPHAFWDGLQGGGPGHFLPPVRWLLGRDLLASLRSIVVYGAFGDELDHRDWMVPQVIELPPDADAASPGEYWFDYLADAGDGQLAMYNLAYCCLSDLALPQDAVDGVALSVNAQPPGALRLPRGRFLFIGGDSAYHIADHATLEERLGLPFAWAWDEVQRACAADAPNRAGSRFLFAIPGNHDYYDSLGGFNRQFRAPLPGGNPPLPVADFTRRQESSFVALALPFDWQMWGLDTQAGKIDYRQRRFFAQLRQHMPEKLIVATPEPSTVKGRVWPDSTMPFAALDLPRPFLNPPAQPDEGFIHLDLSGDVHHYARYWGGDGDRYASVVSGGGGAFMHPSHTELGPPPPTGPTPLPASSAFPAPAAPATAPTLARWPSVDISRKLVTRRLLCPWYIISGGYIWLMGALAAAILYFGATVSAHTRVLLQPITALASLLGARPVQQPPESTSDILNFLKDNVMAGSGRGGSWRPDVRELSCFLVTLVTLAVVASLTVRRIARAMDSRTPEPVYVGGYLAMLSLLLLPPAAVVIAYAAGAPTPPLDLHPLRSTFFVLFYVGIFFAGLAWVVHYTASLPKQAKRSQRHVTYLDYLPVWIVMGFGVGSAAFGIMRYGADSIAQLVGNALVLSVLVVGLLALPLLGALYAAGQRAWHVKLGFGLLGLWQGVLLLTLPLLLTVYGGPATIVVALLVLAGNALAATFLSKRSQPWLLLASWVALGLLAVFVAGLHPQAAPPTIARVFLAGLTGAFFTCAWFGWYLAVCLAFGGHNNEAGGAARIDRYRQFIRFRLTPSELTAYVIGVQRPAVDASQMRPVLIESFTLRGRPHAKSPPR